MATGSTRRSRRTTTRGAGAVLAGLVGLTTVAGCGDDGDNGGSSEPQVIEITFENGEVTPNGERVEVGIGDPIDLEVTADEPGEIHIHSDPEQEIPYDAGTETFEIQIDRAGVVDVESHELDQVIVQLEAR